MATQQGTMALVFNAPDADITLGGQNVAKSQASGIILTDVAFTATGEEVVTKDGGGNTVNITTFDLGAEATLTIKPRGTTAANAITANGYFPSKGDACVVVNAASVSTFTDPDFSASSSGRSYRVSAASKNSSSGQAVTWSVTIQRFDSISSMAALS